MLVFNFVQSDMAFLPVVAPDSFVEVATLRAMKIPTGWNEMKWILCASLCCFQIQISPRLHWAPLPLQIIPHMVQRHSFRWTTINLRGRRDGIWTCSVKSPMVFRHLPTPSQGPGVSYSWSSSSSSLVHVAVLELHTPCSPPLLPEHVDYKIFGTVNQIWCTECPNCLCPNLGPH